MLRKLFISLVILMLLVGIGLGIYFLRPSKRYARHYTKGLIYFDQNKYVNAIVEFNAAKEIKSEDDTLLMHLAESYRRNKQNDKSISILKEIIAKSPKHQKATTLLMENYIVKKEYLKALVACNDYLKIDKSNADLVNQKGLVLVIMKQTSQAKEEFLQAIKLANEKPDAYSNLARLYWQEKDVDNAVVTLKKFLEIKLDNFDLRNQLGYYYQFSNQFKEAAEQFTYLYENNPSRIYETAPSLSLALLALGKMDELQKVVDAVFSKNPSKLEVPPILWYTRGVLFLEKKQYEKAIADLEFAKQRKLRLVNLPYSLALCYSKVEKTTLALKELESLIDQQPNYIVAHQLLVQLLIDNDESQKAVNHCDKYLSKIPDNVQLRQLKAMALSSSGKKEQAQSLYQNLSKSNSDPSVNKRSDVLLAISQGKNKEAVEKLHQILKEETQTPHPIYLLLARNYLILKNYDKAAEYAHSASEAEAVRLSAWQILAQVYVSLQKPQKAIEQYQKILEDDPRHQQIPLELADLHYQMRQTDKALDVLQKHGKMNSTRTTYLELLANISYQKKEYEKAAEYLEAIKSKTSTHKKRLGDIYRQLGKQKKAIEAYGQEENDPAILIRQSLALFLDKKWSQSAEKLSKYIELEPKQTLASVLYCVALMKDDYLEKALEHSAEVLQKTSSSEWLVRFTRSVIYLRKDSFSSAQNELDKIPPSEKALAEGVKELVQFSNKQQMDILPVLSVLLISEMGDSNAALKLHKRLSGLLKTTLFVRYLQAILMEKTGKVDKFRTLVDSLASEENQPAYINAFIGRSLNHLGRFKEAEKFLVMALPMHQESSNMIMELANNYIFTGKSEQAIKTFQLIANLRETEQNKVTIAHACNNIAWLMAQNTSQLKEALEYAKRANSLVPNFPSFLDTLGWVYFQGKKWKGAEKYFAKALQISPQKNSIKLRLAQVYIKLDRKNEAKRLLKEILARKISERMKKDAQDLLDSLS